MSKSGSISIEYNKSKKPDTIPIKIKLHHFDYPFVNDVIVKSYELPWNNDNNYSNNVYNINDYENYKRTIKNEKSIIKREDIISKIIDLLGNKWVMIFTIFVAILSIFQKI